MRIEEKEYTKSIDISIWKKVFPFLAPRKNVLIMVIVMNILCSVVDIIMPLFQRQAIDSFIEKNTLAGLGWIYPVQGNERRSQDHRVNRLGCDRYAVGYLLCSGCVCGNAVSELETGFGDHADRSSYCSSYLVFPE